MSRLDKILWKSESLSIKVRGSLNIPEVAVPPSNFVLPGPIHTLDEVSQSLDEAVPQLQPFSPTPSIDSGRWTGTALLPSTKYFVHGGPGFSIGILDSTTGSLEHLPVPVPTLSFLEDSDASNFSLSEVTSLALAGKSQVWAGTETGSLHVFDLSPGPRLSNHAYSKLPDPVTCLRTGQITAGRDVALSTRYSSLNRMEVLAGSPNGNLTIISGEADERGGLKNVAKCPRKVIQLGGFKGVSGSVIHCMVFVTTSGAKEDCYWCGCGSSIVILRRSSWKVLIRLNGSPKPQAPHYGMESGASSLHNGSNESEAANVSQLEATEYGVWSTTAQSPTMVLWDATDFAPKMNISCFNSGPETPMENVNAQVTVIVCSESLLLVGTQGGYLLIFSIQKRLHTRTVNRTRHISYSTEQDTPTLSLPNPSPKSRRTNKRGLEYKLVAATHCCPRPVVSIHLVGIAGISESPLPSSPNHCHNILVMFGSGDENGTSCQGLVHLYEMGNSPLSSPMTSPQGRLSSSSSLSISSLRRGSLQDSDTMPKLRLHRVTEGSVSYLPLPDNSLW